MTADYCTYCKVFNNEEELLEEVNFVGFTNPIIDEGYTFNHEYGCKDYHLYKVFVLECKKCGAVYLQSERNLFNK